MGCIGQLMDMNQAESVKVMTPPVPGRLPEFNILPGEIFPQGETTPVYLVIIALGRRAHGSSRRILRHRAVGHENQVTFIYSHNPWITTRGHMDGRDGQLVILVARAGLFPCLAADRLRQA